MGLRLATSSRLTPPKVIHCCGDRRKAAGGAARRLARDNVLRTEGLAFPYTRSLSSPSPPLKSSLADTVETSGFAVRDRDSHCGFASPSPRLPMACGGGPDMPGRPNPDAASRKCPKKRPNAVLHYASLPPRGGKVSGSPLLRHSPPENAAWRAPVAEVDAAFALTRPALPANDLRGANIQKRGRPCDGSSKFSATRETTPRNASPPRISSSAIRSSASFLGGGVSVRSVASSTTFLGVRSA